jgi:hypothetical protein
MEHIYPENPVDHPIDDIYVGMIGNLILVDSKLNERLGNKKFNDKKQIFSKSSVFLDEIIKDSTSWNEDKIFDRTDLIGEKLYNEVFRF